jgi:hypothetical protein
MQLLEVNGVVQPIYGSLSAKGLKKDNNRTQHISPENVKFYILIAVPQDSGLRDAMLCH